MLSSPEQGLQRLDDGARQGWVQHTEGGGGSRAGCQRAWRHPSIFRSVKCAGDAEGIVWDFGGLMNGGEGPARGSRILRKRKGAGARAEGAGTAPCPASQPGGRADGAPFGAGWEAGGSLLALLLSA